MTSRQLRVLRGAAASGVATVLAAVSHTIGGATAPHPLLVLSLAALLTPAAALLVGRRPARHRIAITVVFAQVVFHGLFTLLGAPVIVDAAVVPVGHVHDLSMLLGVQQAAPDGGAAAAGIWMLTAHLIAAAATCALLWHGEHLLRSIAGWVRAVLRRAITIALRCPAAPALAVPAPSGSVFSAPCDHIRRRGPPVAHRG